MNKSSIIWTVVVIIALAVTFVFLTSQRITPASPNAADQVYVFKTATDLVLGNHLVSSTGLTLYTYKKDMQGLSTCVDKCTDSWRPYTSPSSGALTVESSITGTISTLTRKDGTVQMTYNGAPLYLWKYDLKPGDVTGDNSGGVWFVARP